RPRVRRPAAGSLARRRGPAGATGRGERRPPAGPGGPWRPFVTCGWLSPVHLRRVEHLVADDLPLAGPRLVLAEEAAFVTLVTRRPDLFDMDEQHVLVAVG